MPRNHRFCLKQKQSIVKEAYAAEFLLKPTARKYEIGPNQIRSWKRSLLRVDPCNINSTRRTVHIGRKFLDSALYNGLHLFIDSNRLEGNAVTIPMLVIKYCSMNNIVLNGNKDYYKYYYRLARWVHANQYTIRMATHVAQNTVYLENIIHDWVLLVAEKIKDNEYDDDCIVNMDETNVPFEVKVNKTLHKIGGRTVSIKTNGSAHRCTVFLACTKSGRKLPPYIVFKAKPNGRVVRSLNTLNAGAKYTVQENAWCDQAVMLDWIQQVWRPFALEMNRPTYLILDEFKVHHTGATLRALQDVGTEIDFIVAGYTSRLQVMDVGVNKPFKDYMRQVYLNSRVEDQAIIINRSLISHWIISCFANVSVNSIINTWNKVLEVANFVELPLPNIEEQLNIDVPDDQVPDVQDE